MKMNIEQALTEIKGKKVNGVVYIHAVDYKTGANGKPFATGQFADQGVILPFKVWSDNLESFKALVEKKIINIQGTIDTWNGNVSVVVDKAEEDIFGYVPADFLLGHDRHKLEHDFDEFLNTVMSPNARKLVNLVICGDVRERFFTEFAAKGMHDACPSGLANHTVKMLRYAKCMIENDARWKQYEDIIYVGVIFHDMGKIHELYMGAYTKNSFNTHRGYACEMLFEHKADIIALYDEDFYYRLLDIMRGHHHAFEERAKTIYGYIVHLIDMMESQCTRLMDALDSQQYNESSSGERIVGHHEDRFYY